MSDVVKRGLELIEENDVKYVDLRFTDPRGKVHHVSQHVRTIDEDSLVEGFMFDGSSIAGWKAINESRSEEHKSELQSLMRISYAVFCLKKKTNKLNLTITMKHINELETLTIIIKTS